MQLYIIFGKMSSIFFCFFSFFSWFFSWFFSCFSVFAVQPSAGWPFSLGFSIFLAFQPLAVSRLLAVRPQSSRFLFGSPAVPCQNDQACQGKQGNQLARAPVPRFPEGNPDASRKIGRNGDGDSEGFAGRYGKLFAAVGNRMIAFI